MNKRNPDDSRRNADFTQWNNQTMPTFAKLIRKSPVAAEALILLASQMGRKTNAVWVSQSELARMLDVTRPTVSKAIKLLKAEKWLNVTKDKGVVTYEINADVFWQAAGNEKHKARFYMRMGEFGKSRYPGVLREDIPRLTTDGAVDGIPTLHYRDVGKHRRDLDA